MSERALPTPPTPPTLPAVDGRLMLDVTAALCRIPSPTGFTDAAVEYAANLFTGMGLSVRRTVKGSLIVDLPAARDPARGGRVLSAHVDTLGLMVKEIKKTGRPKLTRIGGYDWSTIEGEYCTVHTASGREITGTILTTKTSFHVHGQALVDLKRDEQTMELRLDEPTTNAAETRALGVEVGDYVSLDPRTVILPNGYIKSRHLDDKACVAILAGVARALLDADSSPAAPSHLYISTFEEVGHGTSAGLPDGVEEVIAVDMAAVGEGQTSNEFATTVCVKDSTGPYDHGLSRRLIDLAKTHGIDYRVDIYPNYGSDVSQALRAGYDIRGALVGPGVDGSHAFERLHQRSLEETARLLVAYLLE